MAGPTEFQYRVPWRAVSAYPGSHRSSQRGGGYEVLGLAPLYAGGDPRRVDLRASLRDPFGRLLVRVYKQRSIIPVIALADISASMGFVGETRKFELLTEFIESLAYSAYRAGDPFGMVACDSNIRHELSLPATRARNAGHQVSARLRRWAPVGANATGLLSGADQLQGKRSLVFLISDFHLPLDLLRALLSRLCSHAVIPVALIDSAEARTPGAGIAHLVDAETKSRRTVILRRSLAERLKRELELHNEQIRHCLADYNLRPLYIIDRFDADSVNRYFHE